MRRPVLVWGLCVMASTPFAQPPGGRGGQRPPLPPVQQAAAAAKRQPEMNAPRPSDWCEARTVDAIQKCHVGREIVRFIQ